MGSLCSYKESPLKYRQIFSIYLSQKSRQDSKAMVQGSQICYISFYTCFEFEPRQSARLSHIVGKVIDVTILKNNQIKLKGIVETTIKQTIKQMVTKKKNVIIINEPNVNDVKILKKICKITLQAIKAAEIQIQRKQKKQEEPMTQLIRIKNDKRTIISIFWPLLEQDHIKKIKEKINKE